ncbi:MAG: calcium-translocating P-type ATPase, SERCA-type [Syntrophomonadaceae bacterium]|jgi:Ca2+-transporting ATPase|nr:calcium-translocating P-type ATPase, SERCA-type [Syntrophomonadaceae bacterium]
MKKEFWTQITIEEALRIQNSNLEYGLTFAEIAKRQQQYKNKLEETKAFNPLLVFLNQFTDTMVLVLLGATVLSGLIGAMEDAITIMAIVTLNAVLGFLQEYRAEKSLEEIKKLSTPYALVLRDGNKAKIPTEDLVPGDIVYLETGDKIPADIRLIQSHSMEIDEAILTGESLPVAKQANLVLKKEVPLAEKINMAFMGTSVTKGRGLGIVVETGMSTIMGEIAHIIKTTEAGMTPLQIKLDQLGKILIVICLAVCFMVAIMGIYRGESMMTMLMAGISLAVAAIPEGLPAIVTVVLALGIQRMAKRNAIIRKLPAVETLGCTTVICSDKTGTLTQNKMTAKRLATLDKIVSITGDGYHTKGRFIVDDKTLDPLKDTALNTLLDAAFYCNNSSFHQSGKKVITFGDPTEIALLVMAKKAGYDKNLARIHEIPFDAERKKMTVVVRDNDQALVLVKGALEEIIKSCDRVIKKEQIRKLRQADINAITDMQEEWANEALRVLGFAYKRISSDELAQYHDHELEKNLILVGAAGLIDPPRPGVEKAISECLGAGIIPLMITGDHPVTAIAIAREIGLTNSRKVITGTQIDHLSDEDLYKQGLEDRVFARVSPQHKNRIVKVLQSKNHVVAMTGDGVNDAPAVKAADIGIAMGITGTEVTKEASSMVLADDDFSTIIRAVYEGRAIYDNIRKFLRYLLGCNIGEILVMFLSSLMGMPLPLLPIQILWVNLVTDGLPAMALGLEPAEPYIMNRKPRPKNESIFARGMGWIVFGRGVYIGIITLFTFAVGALYCRYHGIDELNMARTMALTTLVFAQLFYVFECRSEKFTPFELGFFTNKYLLIAVLISIIMQMSALYLPALQSVFKTTPLAGWQWLLIIALSGSKFFLRYALYTAKSMKNVLLKYQLGR